MVNRVELNRGQDYGAWPSGPRYNQDQIAINSQIGNPQGLAMSPDGTRFYVTESSPTTAIYQYDTATPFVLAGSTYDGSNGLASTTSPDVIFFSADGLQLFVCDGSATSIDVYDLATAFDITDTVTFNETVDVSAGDVTDVETMYFSPDGTKFFLFDNPSSQVKVDEFTLSTPWDLSSLSFEQSYTDGSPDVANYQGRGWFRPDGKVMYIFGYEGTTFGLQYAAYTLSTAWDLSTVTAPISAGTFAEASDAVLTTISREIFAPDGQSILRVGHASSIERVERVELA